MKALVGGSGEVLASRSCKIRSSSSRRSCGDPNQMLSEAFARSSTGPCEKLLKRSWWNPPGVFAWSGTGPCQKILWKSCWQHPQEVLALRPWRSPCACMKIMIWYRSLSEDLVEILLAASSRGPCIKTLKIPLCLYESSSGMLMGSFCMRILWAPLYGSI